MAFMLAIAKALLSGRWGPVKNTSNPIKLDTKVKNPVNPKELLNRHYWLNGRTQLTYLYTNFWNVHVFKVGGLCDKHKVQKTVTLTSDEVSQFLSKFIEFH